MQERARNFIPLLGGWLIRAGEPTIQYTVATQFWQTAELWHQLYV